MKFSNLHVCLALSVLAFSLCPTSHADRGEIDFVAWERLVKSEVARRNFPNNEVDLLLPGPSEDSGQDDRDNGSGERETRSLDGRDNNREHPGWGSAGIPLLRKDGLPASYGDGLSSPGGSEWPGAREVSNRVVAQEVSIPNSMGTSDFVWQWGQFLDHDIDLTESAEPEEIMIVSIPEGDSQLRQPLKVKRSVYDRSFMPRAQLNQVTAWIDASQVYGSSEEEADSLRTNDGSGRLRTSHNGLYLPYEVSVMMGEPGSVNTTTAEETPTSNTTETLITDSGNSTVTTTTPPRILFQAGDIRVNEQAGLTTMHTLFVREHNRLAEDYARSHSEADDEEIYQYCRRIVRAEVQRITFVEFLPVLLGEGAIPDYTGYRADVNPSILNSFSTAAYRFGHSTLSHQILRHDAMGNVIEAGNLTLEKAFFCPNCILNEGGIEPILRGLAAQRHQNVDIYVIDDIRNILFRTPMDLASLNIMRGRDHGLPSYASTRVGLGLGQPSSFMDISSDTEVQRRLRETYGSLDKIDLWIGGLAEDPVEGALVGETFRTIMTCQFTPLRDGDRFWYERAGVLTEEERRLVNNATLADIIRRNTEIGSELPNDVFHVSIVMKPDPVEQSVTKPTASEMNPESTNQSSAAPSIKTTSVLYLLVGSILYLI
ncbi:MAG: peroxidase family protein [Endozoicomonas sp.]